MVQPTSRLPLIKNFDSFSLEKLRECLEYLRLIYNPPVRGSRRRRARSSLIVPRTAGINGFAPEDLETLRNDAYERAYSMRWLSALISYCGADFGDITTADIEPGQDDSSSRTKEALLQNAVSLLATCAGTASAGVIVRQFSFKPSPQNSTGYGSGAEAITIQLTDVPLDNQDYGSVGAQTWGGACIMAEMIVEQPSDFIIMNLPAEPRLATRYIELGAGTGLVSLAVAKLIERQNKSLPATPSKIDIVATDYYPSVLANLEKNIQSNFPRSSAGHNIDAEGAIRIVTEFLDWSTFSESESQHEAVFDTPFDVVFGADIIYEAQHATWIKACLKKLLRKPNPLASPAPTVDPTFHLIIPLRATHTAESITIEEIFLPYNPEVQVHGSWTQEELELVIKRKETIICDAESGSGNQGEEVEYAYYKIGWGVSVS
ncbi:hypothetical protein B0H34DRAFT_205023 [Crassisporium funariophilum]|nr:hypothetical protein B0H34DRAFT_205023 [Crassisporium funariophilum]